MAAFMNHREQLRVLNRQLDALEALPLLSEDAASLFTDDELAPAVRATRKHLALIYKLIAEGCR